jgi:hypothetical protein
MTEHGGIMTVRLSLIALALALPLAAQSDNASSIAPLQIFSRVTTVDDIRLTGKNGPVAGLFSDVQNISVKNVLSYTFSITFLDPSTNTKLRGSGSHERSTRMPNDKPLRPGECQCSNPKPLVIPKTESGALAQVSTTLEFVLFEDGSTWGTPKTRPQQALEYYACCFAARPK